MFNKLNAISVLNANAEIIARSNADRYRRGLDSHLKYGRSQCAHYVKVALIQGGLSSDNSEINSAKDYGPWLIENNFKPVLNPATVKNGGVYSISGQQAGDVVVIQAAPNHVHGHMAMFDGSKWISDFAQDKGFYPAQVYRDNNIAYTLYRYTDNTTETQSVVAQKNISIVWPIHSNSRGGEFKNKEAILEHLAGESTGLFLVGRSGMWHPGIHITQVTTPWCALSGKAVSEHTDFPVAYKGEQAVRCMADGEVVAYRICQDYLDIPWESGPLLFSGSFLLVRHYIQPGETEKSGLHFYTLYMHLAPYSAYDEQQDKPLWTVQNALSVYHPDWLMVAASHNPDSVNSSYRAGTIPKGAIVEWDESDDSLHVMGFNQRKYGLVTYQGLNEEAQKNNVKTSLKAGQQYWMLVDNHNIAPGAGSVVLPAWWRSLMPPAKDSMIFDQVVCPEPFAIHAGDPVGHLGYYQSPKDGSYVSRYQVHIECFSMDENLPQFLNNPEKVGAEHPLWLKYSPDLELYSKNIRAGTFAEDGRVTSRSGLLKLSDLRTETDDTTKEEYWQLPPENGYVPKGLAQLELLSQYDLGKLGFRTEIVDPPSFDYLDGKTQPVGLVRRIIEWILEVAKNDPRPSHAMAKHGYQYLLNKIDSGEPYYSSGEYLRAVHRPDYQDVVQKAIVKHPSDWYHKKGDAIWQSFLEPLKKEAPEWKAYSEAFIDKMAWMQDASKLKLGPSLWHMHPVMFLGFLMPRAKHIGKITGKDFVKYVFAEAKENEETSRVPAAITTAQAILETGYGKSVPTDIKSKKYSYNIFGIKAHGNQDYVEDYTHEVENGKRVRIIDKFQAYDSYSDSIKGRADFFKKNPRYHFLFNSSDPIKWAKGLQKAGYATDPNYANSLISVMKSQGLIK
ncbi:glycoside hydrolase family 73 protein [Enterobacter cloacae complex sp. ESBL7]|uniref:glycoside hydrolase family 73 protein n=1 Tax=Enterobacter cloacae complex sp. ESBL7 TaxID=3163325 RepID=UPI0035649C94